MYALLGEKQMPNQFVYIMQKEGLSISLRKSSRVTLLKDADNA